MSSFYEISCGVPPGSIFCLLFFLIYINDLCQISNIYDLVLFADDTNVFFSHFAFPTLMNLINFDWNAKVIWLVQSQQTISKYTELNNIIFKPTQWRDEFTLNAEINGVKTKQVKEVNFLGLILDETSVMKTPYFSGCEQTLQVCGCYS